MTALPPFPLAAIVATEALSQQPQNKPGCRHVLVVAGYSVVSGACHVVVAGSVGPSVVVVFSSQQPQKWPGVSQVDEVGIVEMLTLLEV